MTFAIQKAVLKKSDRILDIGCGRGELVAHLDEKGFDVTGIDYSADAIQFAKKSYPGGKFHVVRSDEAIFESQSFDKIFLLGTIEHLYEEEIHKTLLEIKRLLKPEGICIITTCTNSLYYKNWTYRLRNAIASTLSRLGLPFSKPLPPRSEEDEQMHVNEKNYFSLRKSLASVGLPFSVIPRPNPKVCSIELYGKNLPADFPLHARSEFRQKLYRLFIFHLPLNLLLARSHLGLLKAPLSR